MVVIFALGNPEPEYSWTRHNIAKEFLNWAFPRVEWKEEKNFEYSRLEDEVILAKSCVFMNESGKAILSLMAKFKVKPEDIFVVHDDMDLPPGKAKITFDGGSAGHKGVQDIIEKVGKNFWRIKIGIGKPPSRELGADWVLSKLSPDEIELAKKLFDKIKLHLPEVIRKRQGMRIEVL